MMSIRSYDYEQSARAGIRMRLERELATAQAMLRLSQRGIEEEEDPWHGYAAEIVQRTEEVRCLEILLERLAREGPSEFGVYKRTAM